MVIVQRYIHFIRVSLQLLLYACLHHKHRLTYTHTRKHTHIYIYIYIHIYIHIYIYVHDNNTEIIGMQA